MIGFSGIVSNNQTNNKKLIVGRWRSKADHKYEIVFTKSAKIDYYRNKITSSSLYWIKGDTLIVKDKSDSSYNYYSIENLSNNYLSLMYLARGNMLVFQKEH